MFHQSQLHPETAKAFFNAGLISVDHEVEDITPLMVAGPPCYVYGHQTDFSRFFGLVEFLISKGARLDKEVSSRYIKGATIVEYETLRRHRVIHRTASMCWTSVLNCNTLREPFNVEDVTTIARLGSTKIWREILGGSVSDPCDCACSSGGCRPINLALKSSHRGEHNWTIFNTPVWQQDREIDYVFGLGMILLENLEGRQIEEDVIRFFTFSALGLTHTCCCHERHFSPEYGSKMISLMDEAEVCEIHEEESLLIDRLNRLVGQFMQQFHELAIPLTTFLREHWRQRISAEVLENDIISKDEKARFEELGVKVLEDD
ncbi:MAG: hypothetical protein M1822_004846 [Bathelium mastoideum]|nr:MAG: hypothetical protein M1822_004846 [Bathelium mastoideum]